MVDIFLTSVEKVDIPVKESTNFRYSSTGISLLPVIFMLEIFTFCEKDDHLNEHLIKRISSTLTSEEIIIDETLLFLIFTLQMFLLGSQVF